MKKSNTLSAKRIEEIKAFKDKDFSDCKELTDKQLPSLKPRYPEHFKLH